MRFFSGAEEEPCSVFSARAVFPAEKRGKPCVLKHFFSNSFAAGKMAAR